MADSLQIIKTQLENNPASITLSEQQLDSGILERIKTLFQLTDDLEFSNLENITGGADFVSFTGTFKSLLSETELLTTCYFFDHPDTQNRQFLFLGTLPDEVDASLFLSSFRIRTEGIAIVNTVATEDEAVRESEDPPSMLDMYAETLVFSENNLLFSSLDYTLPENEDVFYPAELKAFLPVQQVKDGLHFKAEMTIFSEVASLFESIFNGTHSGALTCRGLIQVQELIIDATEDEDGVITPASSRIVGPNLLLTWEMNAKKDLGMISPSLQQIGLAIPLTDPSVIFPEVLVDGRLNINGSSFDITLSLDLAAHQLYLAFKHFPTLGEVLSLLDLEALNLDFSGILEDLLSIQLSDAGLIFDQRRPAVSLIYFDVDSDEAIQLAENLISLKPALKIIVYNPLNEVERVMDGTIGWEGSIHLGGQEIAINGTLPLPGSTLTISSDAPFTLADSLDGFGNLLQVDIADFLPDNINDLGSGLQLDGIEVSIDLATRTVENVELAVKATNQFALIPGVDSFKANGLSLYWNVETPFLTAIVEAGMGGLIQLPSADLAFFAGFPDYSITVELADGEPINVVELLEALIPDLPTIDTELMITELEMVAEPKTKAYNFHSNITSDWELDLDFVTLGLKELALTVDRNPSRTTLQIVSKVRLFETDFVFITEKTNENFWYFSGQIDQPVSIFDLVATASKDTLKMPTEISDSLTISIEELFFSTDTSSQKRYSFTGVTSFEILNVEGIAIDASVGLTINSNKSGATRNYEGALLGKATFRGADADFFEQLELEVAYTFSKTQRNALVFRWNAFEASLSSLEVTDSTTNKTVTHKLLTFTFNDFSLKSILALMVQLVDADIDAFQLDPPWDAILEKVNLNGLQLIVNLTTKEIIAEQGISKDLGFLKLESFRIAYTKNPRTKKKKIDLQFTGEFLGIKRDKNNPVGWDPLNESPPEVPGQGAAIFDIRYLGLGQHVAIKGLHRDMNIQAVMGLLKGSIEEGARKQGDQPVLKIAPTNLFGDDGAIAFSPQSEWLIGAEMALLKTVNLSLIFNDPFIYGLRLELYGKMAKKFAGLEFEILYMRIDDNTGVYHVEFELPDAFRSFTVGAVSITLPTLVLDIFTNGDFKVDLGFPWDFNFSRSFAIEVFPFIGKGGFYFNKLSAATATSTPKPKPGQVFCGEFTPVYEFGIGLQLGLGKSFEKGPFTAEISISIQGMIQGVISWYNSEVTKEKTLYYAIRGGVSIVAKLIGEVDFVVIAIKVEVTARATVQFAVITYKPIYVKLKAEVEVEATVVILGIEVEESFEMTVEQEFTIGEETTAIWDQEAVSAGTKSRSLGRRRTRALRKSRFLPKPITFNWKVRKSRSTTKEHLDLYFQTGVAWTNEGGTTRIKGEALFFLENKVGADTQDFDKLNKALFKWVCESASFKGTKKISKSDLQAIYTAFTKPESQFGDEHIIAFLVKHFNFRIQHAPTGAIKGVIFPVLPQLKMTFGGGKVVDFSTIDYQLDGDEIINLRQHFKDLEVQFDPTKPSKAAIAETKAALTNFVFRDYLRLLIRSTFQYFIEYLADSEKASIARLETENEALPVEDRMDKAEISQAAIAENTFTLKTLLEEMEEVTRLKNVPNIASHYLLHGIRLPKQNNDEAINPGQAFYEATEQQFDLTTAKIKDTEDYQITIEKTAGDLSITFSGPTEEKELTTLIYDKTNPTYPAFLAEIKAFEAEPAPVIPATIQLTDYYQQEPLNFAFRKLSVWEIEGAADKYLLALPKSMERYLLKEQNNPTFKLYREKITDGQTEITKSTTIDAFSWGTRIELTIEPVPNLDRTGLLPDVFSLTGMQEHGKKLLASLATSEVAGLDILYQVGGENTPLRTIPGQKNAIQLIKNNLVLEFGTSTSSGVYTANLTEIKEFLTLALEASKVEGGGYYLQIPHDAAIFKEKAFNTHGKSLFEILFAEAQQATIILYLNASDKVVKDYQNTISLGVAVNLEEELILAEADNITIPVQRIPAGYLGFELTRPIASYDAKVNNLYQILGYQVLNFGGFNPSQFGMPIGPTCGTAENKANKERLYERTIPTFSLAKNGTGERTFLPEVDNPYRGIIANAEIKINTWWQDIYGNCLSLKTATALPVGYTDPIIGISQWPSASVNYELLKATATTARLLIELTFDTSLYAAHANQDHDARLKSIASAKALYKSIYYQLNQPDVKLYFDTSIIVSPAEKENKIEIDKGKILDFIEQVYTYLEDTTVAMPSTDPIELTLNFATQAGGNTTYLFPTNFIYPINVNINICRAANLIHSEYKGNADYKNIEQSNTLISPKMSAPVVVDAANNTLTTLANKWAQDNGLELTVAELIKANALVKGILKEGTNITLDEGMITIVAEDTFTTLAERIVLIEQDESLSDVIERVLSERLNLLVKDKTLAIGDDNDTSITIPDIDPSPNEITTQSLANLVDIEGFASVTALVDANLNRPAILVIGTIIKIGEETVEIVEGDTFKSLAEKIILAEQAASLLLTFEQKVANEPNLLVTNSRLSVGAVGLRQFTANFQRAIPQLRLAVSKAASENTVQEDDAAVTNKQLWAVQFGSQGITYDLKEATPAFFALKPLSVALASEDVVIDDYNTWKGDKIKAVNAAREADTTGKEIAVDLTYLPTQDIPKNEFEEMVKKRIEAIDINLLARTFLVAVEDFLQPSSLTQANQLLPDKVATILSKKEQLADTISDKQLELVLKGRVAFEREAAAKDAIQRQLLTNLVEGYDVETVVQYEATVEKGAHSTTTQAPRLGGKAKVIGVEIDGEESLGEIDFSIAAGKIELKPGTSYFTYLFDTKTPEKFSSLRLELNFDTAEIEYFNEQNESIWLSFILPADLKTYRLTKGVADKMVNVEAARDEDRVATKQKNYHYVPSDLTAAIQRKTYASAAEFLKEVTPIFKGNNLEELRNDLLVFGQLHTDNPGYMGETVVPIPLRNYPMPPSLIRHQAEADVDSLTDLTKIKEWAYTMIYEHPDIAQDSIDCVCVLNTKPQDLLARSRSLTVSKRDNLFKSLANFVQCYPAVAQDLKQMEKADANPDTTKLAITAFSVLMEEVVNNWEDWTDIYKKDFEVKEGDLHYRISENVLSKKATITPVKAPAFPDPNQHPEPVFNNLDIHPNPALDLPGYDPISTEIINGDKVITYNQDKTEQLTFGDSAIPDRLLKINNLDVIRHQNVLGTIWLSRNEVLIKGRDDLKTNDNFIFRTPPVSFNNVLAPYLVNHERWDIAAELNVAGRSFEEQLEALFNTLLPKEEANTSENGYKHPNYDFELRLSCRFGFPMAKGNGIHYDMISTLPVLLGQRLTKVETQGDRQDSYQQKLAERINSWVTENDPPVEGARFIFSINLFSKLDQNAKSSLPMLRIEHLELKLADIEEYAETLVVN